MRRTVHPAHYNLLKIPPVSRQKMKPILETGLATGSPVKNIKKEHWPFFSFSKTIVATEWASTMYLSLSLPWLSTKTTKSKKYLGSFLRALRCPALFGLLFEPGKQKKEEGDSKLFLDPFQVLNATDNSIVKRFKSVYCSVLFPKLISTDFNVYVQAIYTGYLSRRLENDTEEGFCSKTTERWFRRGFCDWAELRSADLKHRASHGAIFVWPWKMVSVSVR